MPTVKQALDFPAEVMGLPRVPQVDRLLFAAGGRLPALAGVHDLAVQIRYGMSTSELVTDVENALAASWGVTGLADVKFTPSF